MRVKLFVKDKGFGGWARFVGRLEDEVNAWLADNPGVRIMHVTQSSNGESLDTSKVFLSIWYEDGPYPFMAPDLPAASPATPPSPGITRPAGPAAG